MIKKDIWFVVLCVLLQIIALARAAIDGREMDSGELYQNGNLNLKLNSNDLNEFSLTVKGAYSVRFGKTEYTVWHRQAVGELGL